MKRIGVIIPSITDNLQVELLDGIHQTAYSHGYDVIVFTTITNGLAFDLQSETMEGEESVYCLIEKANLNGILLVSQYFNKKSLRRKISEIIKRSSVPCIDLGGIELGFETVTTSQDKSVYEITSHVIEKHNCKKLVFLAGFKDNPDSEKRLSGFISAVSEHDCSYEIVYGDFWTVRPTELGNEIIQHKIEKPDAVICANDIMAVSLCETLQKGGLSIPDDIIITGFDGHLSAITNFPSITTISNAMFELGCVGATRIIEIIKRKPLKPQKSRIEIMYGSSCSCIERMRDFHVSALKVKEQILRESENHEMLEMRINADIITRTNMVDSIQDLIGIIDETAHIIKNYKSMNMCLIPNWDENPENPDMSMAVPFPNKMLCAISKKAWHQGVVPGIFETSEIIPDLSHSHKPMLLYILPLHAASQVFGYCGFAYENALEFKASVMIYNFLSAFSNGLRTLRHKLYSEYLQKKIEEASMYDKMTDMLSKKGLIIYLDNQMKLCEKKGIMLVSIAMLSTNSNIKNKNVLSDSIIQSELLLANVIRLVSGKNLQTARLDTKTFAIVFPLKKNETIEKSAENIMIQIEILIRKMQEVSAIGFSPEPYYICGYAEEPAEDCISRLWKAIEENQPKNRRFAGITRLRMLRHEILKAPELNWNLGEIADRLNISKSYVQKLYKENFGISFIDDLINARLEIAKKLLISTDMRVNEIALSCGYQNPTHFMRQFKDKTGVSASEYRNKNIELNILEVKNI